MRERERLKIEKRQEQEQCFQDIKIGVGDIFWEPTFRLQLEIALFIEWRDKEEKGALFENMVHTKAEFCLSGEPEYDVSTDYWCHFLIESLDHLAHARPTLERAVELYRKAGKPMPRSLREWAENPGDPPPKKHGPSSSAQDWKAMRDHIIALAIDWAVGLKQDPEWPQKISIGRAYSSEEEWRCKYSICRAVTEVLEERYGGYTGCNLPTYNVVWEAWQRYRKEMRRNGKLRPGRPLLPPRGLGPVLNPPGIDTDGLRQKLRKISEDHLHRCAQRDFDDSQ